MPLEQRAARQVSYPSALVVRWHLEHGCALQLLADVGGGLGSGSVTSSGFLVRESHARLSNSRCTGTTLPSWPLLAKLMTERPGAAWLLTCSTYAPLTQVCRARPLGAAKAGCPGDWGASLSRSLQSACSPQGLPGCWPCVRGVTTRVGPGQTGTGWLWSWPSF